ncbi:MAG: helix-turn-helix transcriptional regulator [Planctomycetota bacterium]
MRRSNLNRQTAEVLNWLIDKHGFTVSRLAEVMQVDRSFASRCKNGEREYSTKHVQRLADAINMPVGAMLMASCPPRRREDESPEKKEILDLAEDFIAKLDALDAKFKAQLAAKEASSAKEQPPTKRSA